MQAASKADPPEGRSRPSVFPTLVTDLSIAFGVGISPFTGWRTNSATPWTSSSVYENHGGLLYCSSGVGS